MCGIAGVCGRPGGRTAQAMGSMLTHRGPDAAGVHRRNGVELAHRRLSIVDLDTGDQPIVADDGTAIVANGEIYNHEDVRRRVGSSATFATRSDSEAALHLYRVGGSEAMSALDGMYAFAIADGGGLYLARDPVGIKPLYVAESEGGLAFASELKALSGQRHVRPLPPGHHRLPHGGVEPFRVPAPPDVRRRSPRRSASAVRGALERAVDRRLMSDVDVGVFLSGGLDSSIIAALVRRRVPNLHSFSVGIEGSPDLVAARRVAEHLGTIHHEHVFDADEVTGALPEIVHHLESFDRDLVRSAVPTYFVARLASQWVKVIMTGEGADELFGGYRYHRRYRRPDALRRELERSVRSLHDSNLQRVDRMTMAHSIEGRVPFLDLDVVEAAEQIPADLKVRRTSGSVVEKWILRLAVDDLLPADIVWRGKQQFDEGSGLVDVVGGAIERLTSEAAARRHAELHVDSALGSVEESVYHRLLVDGLDDPRPVVDNVSRWADASKRVQATA